MRTGSDVEPLLRAPRRASALGADRLRTARIGMLSLAFLVGSIGLSGVWQGLAVPDLRAQTPAMEASLPIVVAPDGTESVGSDGVEGGDTAAAVAAAGARTVPQDPPGWVRVARPSVPDGPRRVGIQAGHWRTNEAPPELWQLLSQTGAASGGSTEWETNLAIAERVAKILRERGFVVDVLPTIVQPGYLADAVVSLHSDGDPDGVKSGFKLAHSTRRTPHEDALQRHLTEAYGAATGLAYDAQGISNNMRGYYLNSWTRVRNSVSPFTPSVVLEMGFLTHPHDRDLIVNEQDKLARAIAQGIITFLDATPREALFGQDLVVPPFRSRLPSPTPTAP